MKATTQVMYGLRIKGTDKLLEYDCDPCVDEFSSTDKSYYLTDSGKGEWLVDNIEYAKYTMFNSTPYYNADYVTPGNEYVDLDLEIVQVVKTIEYKEYEQYKKIKVKLKKCDLKELTYANDKYDLFLLVKYDSCTAIDLGDKIQIVSIKGFYCTAWDISKYIYDKKLFDIL